MESREFEEIDLHQYWCVLKRRWLPASVVFVLIVALSCVAALRQKPTYQAESRLLFKINRTASLTGLGEGIGQLEPLNSLNNPLDTQAEIIRSAPIIQETIKLLDLRDNQGDLLEPDFVAAKLVVKPVAGTDVLRIAYEAGEPELAADVVNKLIEVYIKTNLQSNRAEAVSARDFIVQQLPSTEEAVKAADQALRQFKEENNVIVLSEEASAAVKIISDLEDQIAQARAQLAEVTAQSRQLSSQVGINTRQAIVFTALSQSSGVQSILSELQQAQDQLAVERTRYRDGYPSISNLERRISALNGQLQERIREVVGSEQRVAPGNLQLGDLQQKIIGDLVASETARLGLIGRINTLLQTQSSYKERASVLPSLEQTQRELERRLQASQATYETLLTKLQEVQLAENQNVGNARVIAPALVPQSPASSSKILLLAGGFVGFLLAIATAFALDLIDQSIKTVKEARDVFGYTLLGVIPSFAKDFQNYPSVSKSEQSMAPRMVIMRDEPHSPINAAYQMLQANLKFLSSDKDLKVIAVTSAVSQEGKSVVSANLAVAMAQMGRKVLLVDADMRRPTQHHLWQLTNALGLSNLIIDQIDCDVVVKPVMLNLDILPSGVIPPNPVALLDSRRMASLVESFLQNYDFVIFDTPTLVGTADAAVLGKIIDGILLVVRPRVVNSSAANAAKEFLKQSGQNVLGMVINDVDVKSEPDSYFYYTRKQSQHILDLKEEEIATETS